MRIVCGNDLRALFVVDLSIGGPEIAGADWQQTLDFAMRNFKDESFISQYLSPRLIREFKLFSILDEYVDSGVSDGLERAIDRDRDQLRALEELAPAPALIAIHSFTPRMAGFVMGTNDLVKDLRAEHTPSREPVITALALALLAARAYGPENVLAVLMPYRSSRPESRADAEALVAEVSP